MREPRRPVLERLRDNREKRIRAREASHRRACFDEMARRRRATK